MLANQVVTSPSLSPGNCLWGTIGYEPLTESASNQDFSAALFGDCSGNWQSTANGLQRDLTTARGNEIQALDTYNRSLADLSLHAPELFGPRRFNSFQQQSGDKIQGWRSRFRTSSGKYFTGTGPGARTASWYLPRLKSLPSSRSTACRSRPGSTGRACRSAATTTRRRSPSRLRTEPSSRPPTASGWRPGRARPSGRRAARSHRRRDAR